MGRDRGRTPGQGESWGRLEPVAGRVVAEFYARLVADSPELRALLPVAPAGQQEHFVAALRRVVGAVSEDAGYVGRHGVPPDRMHDDPITDGR